MIFYDVGFSCYIYFIIVLILLNAYPGSILIAWHYSSLIILYPILFPPPPITSISPIKCATANDFPNYFILYYLPLYLSMLVLNKLKSLAYKFEFFLGKSSALEKSRNPDII